MRLINTKTLKFESPLGRKPEYAILSHTWARDGTEVSFQEMVTEPRPAATLAKPGYAKISKTCEIALQKFKLAYAWIDTCCIDKSSSAELSEAINSMFTWYKESFVCFAFLEDMTSDFKTFNKSRWFTRGWTLQELIAPEVVLFYDQHWEQRCSRNEDHELIHRITGIPAPILRSNLFRLDALYETPVAVRMAWASRRETTREEDIAYSLMGMFDVSMPMLYGEGGIKAFTRLQEEIIRQTEDLSIFAWISLADTSQNSLSGLLAPSPVVFSDSADLEFHPDMLYVDREWTMANQSIRFCCPLGGDPGSGCFILPLHHRIVGQVTDTSIGVFLRPSGHESFVRVMPHRLALVHRLVFDRPIHVPKILRREKSRFVHHNVLQMSGNAFAHTEFRLIEAEPRGCLDPSTLELHGGYMGLFRSHIRFNSVLPDSSCCFVVICLMNQRKWHEQPNGWRCGLLRGEEWPRVQGQLYRYFRESESNGVLTQLIRYGEKTSKIVGEGKSSCLVSIALGAGLKITIENSRSTILEGRTISFQT